MYAIIQKRKQHKIIKIRILKKKTYFLQKQCFYEFKLLKKYIYINRY